MDIASINFNNYLVKKADNKISNNGSNLHLNPQLAQDSVQFTGAAKCLSNIYDKAFVEIMEKDLELTKESATKLKNIIWSFLRERKLESLGDIGAEKYMDDQVELLTTIVDKLHLPEDTTEFISRELFQRCSKGNRYIPDGITGFQKEKELEKKLINFQDMRGYILGVKQNEADEAFYGYIQKALRLSPRQNYEFKMTIENYLKENKLKSIQELGGEDMLQEQAELTELLAKKFNLSETETNAVQWELISRANTSAVKYKPIANVFVKDKAPFDEVIDKGGYNYTIDVKRDRDFSDELFHTMSVEAEKAGYGNIFEIFSSENNPAASKTVEFIKKSRLSEEAKTDLIIDFIKVARDPEAFAENVPKHKVFDNFYGAAYNDIITDKILKRFGLPKSVAEGVKSFVARLQPEHVKGGEARSVEEIAYKIAEKYNLPGKAEKDLAEIINETISGGPKGADAYIMEQLLKEMM